MNTVHSQDRETSALRQGFSCDRTTGVLTGNDSKPVVMNKPVCRVEQYAYILTTKEGTAYDRINVSACKAEIGATPVDSSKYVYGADSPPTNERNLSHLIIHLSKCQKLYTDENKSIRISESLGRLTN
jgi:hypothetical protein